MVPDWDLSTDGLLQVRMGAMYTVYICYNIIVLSYMYMYMYSVVCITLCMQWSWKQLWVGRAKVYGPRSVPFILWILHFLIVNTV